MNATTTLERPMLAEFELEPMDTSRAVPVVQQAGPVAATAPSRPQFTRSEAFIIELLSRGVTQDQIGAVMDLRDRQDAKEQEQAMTKAMAGFKSETIEIIKRKHVKFKTDKGWTEYDHAELADVVEAITPHLSKYGLSVTWKPTKQTSDWVEVTCWVKHDLGGSDQATLGAAPDKTGGKNNIQAIGSTCSYLSRYLTLLLLGLAAKGQDNDGRGGTPEGQAPAPAEPEPPAFYAPEGFAKNFPAWKQLIQDGKKTPAQVIAVAETKAPLSEEQKAAIRACAA
jgi:hypothetical protein